jgi:hypothetical protein
MMRRFGVMRAAQGACVRRRSWAGYTINMFEFEFRTGTGEEDILSDVVRLSGRPDIRPHGPACDLSGDGRFPILIAKAIGGFPGGSRCLVVLGHPRDAAHLYYVGPDVADGVALRVGISKPGVFRLQPYGPKSFRSSNKINELPVSFHRLFTRAGGRRNQALLRGRGSPRMATAIGRGGRALEGQRRRLGA